MFIVVSIHRTTRRRYVCADVEQRTLLFRTRDAVSIIENQKIILFRVFVNENVQITISIKTRSKEEKKTSTVDAFIYTYLSPTAQNYSFSDLRIFARNFTSIMYTFCKKKNTWPSDIHQMENLKSNSLLSKYFFFIPESLYENVFLC